MLSRLRHLATVLLVLLLLAGCTTGPDSGATDTPSGTIPAASPTPDTSMLAALVGAEAITLAEFDNELARFEADQQSIGTDLATLDDYENQVLQAMIDRLLLAQGAQAAGLDIDDLGVVERLGGLILEIGGQERLDEWMQANFFTLESLLEALTKEILAARMVEKIVSEMPMTADQVHASHILLVDRATADYVYQQVLGGGDFGDLAETYSTDTSTRLTGGDLGWFPPGTLTMSEVEEIAFALEPGQVSQPVESQLGYHIVKCIERAEHPLSPQALQRLREEAVSDWLNAQRETVTIEILINT
jgi:parvulin-like peptidyl-prolyl isomerase